MPQPALPRYIYRLMRNLPWVWGVAMVGVLAVARDARQGEPPISGRWVGTHQRQPLHLDFYADTMLVVNDRHPLAFRATADSLVAWGDTSFAVAYWFALDRLLLATREGAVVTMSKQALLARPLEGRWWGSVAGDDTVVELEMLRGGIARWRRAGAGWYAGEWDRATRDITFTWLPDSTTWSARYDPAGNALLFGALAEGGGPVILRRRFR